MSQSTFLPDIAAALPDIPTDSIISRTVVKNDDMDVIVFGFAPGETLSEHTSSRPAMLHFLKGEATVTLGEETHTAVAGAVAALPPHLPHSITAHTETIMLLIMMKTGP